MDRITYLKELYKYIRCVERGFGTNLLPANPKSPFTLPLGYKLLNHPEIPEQFSRGYIELADSKNILSQTKERIYFKGRGVKSIKLSEDQLFRFFVGQAVPRYESRGIRQLGQDVWNKLPNDYRKIAVFSLMYNSSGYFNSCLPKIKDAIRNQRWEELAKYQYDCGAKSRKDGPQLDYLVKRRREEAAMIRTNSMQPGVSFRCGGKIPKESSTTETLPSTQQGRIPAKQNLRDVNTIINKDFDESPRLEDDVINGGTIDLPDGTIDNYDRESESSIFEEGSGLSVITPTNVVTPENTSIPPQSSIGNKRSLSILETNETEFLGQDAKEKTIVSSESSEKAEDDSVSKEKEKSILENKKESLDLNGKDRVSFTSWLYDKKNNTNIDKEDGIDFRGAISIEYVS